jgi:alkylhydroperoxidase family enzyme
MAIARDFRKANLDPKDRAMLEYAEKITLSPAQVGEDDVSGLRKGRRGIGVGI